MFQIVCALALEVPSVLQDIESLHGVCLMLVCPVNHGDDIQTILVGIVTVWALMFMTYHRQPRRHCLW